MRWVAIAWIAVAPTIASAQDDAPELDEGQAQALDAEARALFEAGATAYHAGRFEAALEYFQRSYALSERPELLFNVASAAERARQDRVALEAYEQYVARTEAAPQHTLARNRIEFLRAQLAEAAPEPVAAPPAEGAADTAPPPAAPSPAPTPEDGGDAGPAPWIFLGLGGALAVGGAILVGLGVADRATVENPPPGARWADSLEAYHRGQELETAGAIFLPVGAVVLVTGIVLAVAGPGGGGSSQASLRPHGLGVAGTF
jgi:tetratricopeptide (TPR) repeat protein